MLPSDYIERVYAGVLGKTIGVRHGSNDECYAEHCKAEQLAKLTHGHTSKQHHHEYDDAEQQCR